MPKPKPTQIIRHEIVLGRVEREAVESALTAYQVKSLSDSIPWDAIARVMNDVTGLAAFLILWSMLRGWLFTPGDLSNTDPGSLLAQFQAQQEATAHTGVAPEGAVFWIARLFGLGPALEREHERRPSHIDAQN